MRREGRQRGWVRTYDSDLPAPGGSRRAVDGTAAANGGFVKAPAKPTNHSKFTGSEPYKAHAKVKAAKGARKFRHDEVKSCCLDLLEGYDVDEYDSYDYSYDLLWD